MLRRHAIRWFALALLALVTSAAAVPASSQATVITRCDPGIRTDALLSYRCMPSPVSYRTAGLQHVGWTYLNLNYCPPNAMCALMYRQSMNAWRWSGSSWSQTSLSGGWVYVYPYSGEWRWAWTQDSGWVAVSGGRFEIRPY